MNIYINVFDVTMCYKRRISAYISPMKQIVQVRNEGITLSESVEIENEGAVSVDNAVPHRRFLGTHFDSCSTLS